MDAAGRIFVGDEAALGKTLRALKGRACPFCKRIGTLNRHSHIAGNNPEAFQGRTTRGQRAFCSNRGRRAGCGRTVAILFSFVLPRYTFNARLLWRALAALLTGTSIKAAWEAAQLTLTLDTFYHLLQRFRRRLDIVRTALCAWQAAPHSAARDPLVQTLEHVRCTFRAYTNPLEAFQLRWQRPLLG
jgi:hypothetical protein